jgi:hypothetical protein
MRFPMRTQVDSILWAQALPLDSSVAAAVLFKRYERCRIRIDDEAVFVHGPRALWLACGGSASLMPRMCLNNRMVLRTNRMQAIGPAHQAQNHRNRKWDENGSQHFSRPVKQTASWSLAHQSQEPLNSTRS